MVAAALVVGTLEVAIRPLAAMAASEGAVAVAAPIPFLPLGMASRVVRAERADTWDSAEMGVMVA